MMKYAVFSKNEYEYEYENLISIYNVLLATLENNEF